MKFVENSFALNVTKMINEIKNKSFYFIFSFNYYTLNNEILLKIDFRGPHLFGV